MLQLPLINNIINTTTSKIQSWLHHGKRESPLNWWKLGPREDWALEVGQWSVCLFESKKKKKTQSHTIQCVTVTAIHSTGQE